MPTKIIIYPILVDTINLFTGINDVVTLSVLEPITLKLLWFEQSKIEYTVNKSLAIREYYFEITYYDYPQVIPTLNTSNFSFVFLSSTLKYSYVESTKIMYIFNEFSRLPLQLIGLKNYPIDVSVLSDLILLKVNGSVKSYSKVEYLKNYSLQNENFLTIPGEYKGIVSGTFVDSADTSIIYSFLYPISNVLINPLLKITFYDPSFIRIMNIPYKNKNIKVIDSVNILVILYYEGNQVFQYIINLNYDLITNNQYFYLIFAFKNNTGSLLYDTIKFKIFDYDYFSYFNTLDVGDYINCEKISALTDINLYDILIGTNSNLPQIDILTLDINNFDINISLITIRSIIFFEVKNVNLVSIFLQSGKTEVQILTDFLYNFKIKNYNFYKVNFFTSSIVESQYLKLNNLSETILTQNKDKINFNNLLLNGMLVYIEIFFLDKSSTSNLYQIYGMIFNNNNTWDIYHKNLDLNDENKKQLILDMIITSTTEYNVTMYFYNNIDDLNNNIIIPITSNQPITNPFYRFNRFSAERKDLLFGFELDENNYLKYVLNINLDYIILVFKTGLDITETTLRFKTSDYIFELYKIINPNGNSDPNTNIFYVFFKNIDDANLFLNYIKYGVNLYNEENLSFWEIPESIKFYKNSDGFYTPTFIIGSNYIYFSIIDLDLTSSNVITKNLRINLV